MPDRPRAVHCVTLRMCIEVQFVYLFSLAVSVAAEFCEKYPMISPFAYVTDVHVFERGLGVGRLIPIVVV